MCDVAALLRTVRSVVPHVCPAPQGLGAWSTKSRFGRPLLLALVPALLATVATRAAQEVGPTTRADDLPAEFQVLLGTEATHDYRWTLIGTNEKAQEQEKLHPELNARARSGISPWPEIEASSSSSSPVRSGRAAMSSTSM